MKTANEQTVRRGRFLVEQHEFDEIGGIYKAWVEFLQDTPDSLQIRKGFPEYTTVVCSGEAVADSESRALELALQNARHNAQTSGHQTDRQDELPLGQTKAALARALRQAE